MLCIIYCLTINCYIIRLQNNKIHMHNLKANFDKFYQIITQKLKDIIVSDGNFKFYLINLK